jgi:hypothetical protein
VCEVFDAFELFEACVGFEAFGVRAPVAPRAAHAVARATNPRDGVPRVT